MIFGKSYKTQIKVEGMHCMHCAKRVEDAIKNVDGVKKVDVDLASGNVTVLSKTEPDVNLINKAVENAGYKVI